MEFEAGSLLVRWETPSGPAHGRSDLSPAVLEAGQTARWGPLRLEMRTRRAGNTTRLTVTVIADEPVVLQGLCLEGRIQGWGPHHRFFANGFQSWSESREYTRHQRQHSLPLLTRILLPAHGLDRYGEAFGFPRPGHRFSGWSWAWFRPHGSAEALFLGSVNESLGLTRYLFDPSRGWLSVDVDVEGLHLEGPACLLDLLQIRDTGDAAAATWARTAGLPPPRLPTLSGWTSWYSHYQNISEDILIRDLEGLERLGVPLDVFQIDDGYQSAVGDWRDLRPVFPRGMAYLAQRIHQAGFRAGLWLAPLAVQTSSRIAAKHPEWLVRERDGRPLLAGGNWGGFWALDILHPAVQEHLRALFHTALDEWGYELLKLDFLYAGSLVPRAGLTRAQLLRRTLELFRAWAGPRLLLGCGVPLGPAAGLLDFCRIGTDVEARWSRPLFERLLHPEIPDTRRAVSNALHRIYLHGRAWANDPDVFVLRSRHSRLSRDEAHSLLLLSRLLGGVWFTSDPPDQLTAEEQRLWLAGFPLRACHTQALPGPDGLWTGTTETGGRRYAWAFNPTDRPCVWTLPPGTWAPSRPLGADDPPLELWQGGSCHPLRPHETLLALSVESCTDRLVATVGGLLPGNEVAAVDWGAWGSDRSVRVRLHPDVRVPVWAWVAPEGLERGPLVRVGPLTPRTHT